MAALAGGDSPPPPPAPSKGKAKMEDDDAEAPTCGICYVEEWRAVRGELDCCAHHFCFVCIMAWARVESRCPFCKARFRTIRRPPVPGRFPSERVVPVPERNQVYHPQGNGSSTVGDPYANTNCSVCSCSRDDELLLLCELCDSAAHTYCVGLGNTVPEGDWFCRDCAATREEHLRLQVDGERRGGQGELDISVEALRAQRAPAPSISDFVGEEYYGLSSAPGTHVPSNDLSMDEPALSIYDIVDEDYTTNASRRNWPRLNTEELPSQGTSSAGSPCPGSTRRRDNGLASYHAAIRREVERARTLRNSRNLDKRIRVLRENWAALRDGSVGFAAHVHSRRTKGGTGTVSVVPEHQRCSTPLVIGKKNGAAATSVIENQLSSMPFSEETTTSSGHGLKIPHKDNRDARKAWKMLEMVKTAGGRKISYKPCSLNCSTPFSMGNRSTSHSPIDAILQNKNQNLTNKVTQKNTSNGGHVTKMESTPPTKNSRECCGLPDNTRASVHEGMISSQNRMNQESLNGKGTSSIPGQRGDQSLEFLCSTGRSDKFKSDMLHPRTCSLSSGQSAVTSSLQLGPSAGSQSTMMENPEESSAATMNEIGSAAATVEIGRPATIEVRKSSGQDRHERKRKLSHKKCHDQGSKRSRSICKIAKSEISSLAVRELKLLKIDKTYVQTGSKKLLEQQHILSWLPADSSIRHHNLFHSQDRSASTAPK
ncbi:hypothetical protein ACP70R_047206 [Stipagrostis hirtigluma subsp. patula]